MVASIQAAPSAKYYIEAVSQEYSSEYYLAEAKGLGVMRGEAAKEFGFSDVVTQDSLHRAFAGMRGDGSEKLARTYAGKNRSTAWDITLSPPKSVSVLWASLQDRESRNKIEQCMVKAAERVVDYIEAKALVNRRGKQGAITEQAKGGVFALLPHSMSRAFDPQLHIHLLAFNLCLRSDGKVGAIRSRDLYQHKMAIGALFRAELSYLLQKELGVRVEKDGFAFRVIGVPQSLCDAQSKRRMQIEEVAAEAGWSDPKVLAEVALATRGSKGRSVHDMLPAWSEEAREHNFPPDKARSLLHAIPEQSRDLPAREKPVVSEAVVKTAIATVTKEKAHCFARDFVHQAAVEAQGTGLSSADVLHATDNTLDQGKMVTKLPDAHYPRFSTEENLDAERELISRLESGSNRGTLQVGYAAITNAEQRVEKELSEQSKVDLRLTGDQKATLRHVGCEPGATKFVQGYAGTGKTLVFKAYRLACQAAGFEVIGAGVTGKAAVGLENATGIPSHTVASLLKELNPQEYRQPSSLGESLRSIGEGLGHAAWENWRQETLSSPRLDTAILSSARKAVQTLAKPRQTTPTLTDKSVLVVDEASMLSTRDMLALKRECDRAGAKLILIGDKTQLPSIEAGGPFASLLNRFGHASLTTIVRQRHPWMREAIHAVIEDEPERAMELYAKHGALDVSPSRRKAVERLVDDFRKLKPSALPESLILTSTNAEAQDINAKVQERRKAAGELGMFFVRLPNGERVYKNDRILFTLNHYGVGVRNGMLGTVTKVEYQRGLMGRGAVTIRLDSERNRGFLLKRPQLVKVDLAKYKDLQLGYAVTTHKAQGTTVNKSFVLFGSSMLSKELAFTQLTRAREKCTLYASEVDAGESLSALVPGLRRSVQKDLAMDHTRQKQHVEEQGMSRRTSARSIDDAGLSQ